MSSSELVFCSTIFTTGVPMSDNFFAKMKYLIRRAASGEGL